MLKPMLVLAIALSAAGAPLAAQGIPASPFGAFGEKQPDATQLAAMMANSQRTLKPATFVLSHKTELTLSVDQVRQLDLLARGEDDSLVVRQIRRTAAMTQVVRKRAESNTISPTGWAGPIDEKRLRDEACEQSGMQVEFLLSLLRDRQAVGNILTGSQIDRIQQLEAEDMLRAMRSKQP